MKNIQIVAKQDEIVIKGNYKLQTIMYHDIIFILYDSPYIIINMLDRKLPLHMSLNAINRYLPEYFVLCNRSLIVNLLQVKSFDKASGILYLRTGITFYVSYRKRQRVATMLLSIMTG